MTPLEALIRAEIAADGPMSVSRYMALCLQHPQHGYYVTRDPIGAAGDFTTAPEVSQMFGELLGLWLAQAWLEAGRPAGFILTELGPGRGTLMADILRAGRAVPGFVESAKVALVETSPALRARQAEALAAYDPIWVDRLEDLPGTEPLLVVANEFFDALPIRQFIREGARWCERVIGVIDGRLAFGRAPPVAMAVLDALYPGTAEGGLVEYRPVEGLMAQIRERAIAALIVDYGDWDGSGDTFQAMASHGFVDVFADPGGADLTSHVHFGQLARWAAPMEVQFGTQGAFLQAMGIEARAARLAARGDPKAIAGQVERLTGAEAMGQVFKVLALRAAI